MTTFNYQGMEYDENYIKKHMLYSVNVNQFYMTRVLKKNILETVLQNRLNVN